MEGVFICIQYVGARRKFKLSPAGIGFWKETHGESFGCVSHSIMIGFRLKFYIENFEFFKMRFDYKTTLNVYHIWLNWIDTRRYIRIK